MTAFKVVGVMVTLALSGAAAAQTFTGGLRGAVRDANGIVRGVAVQLVNEATSQTRAGVTNEAGEYSFAAVSPGAYTIKASLTGFKTYERRAFQIGAQQFLTLDISIEIGLLEEAVIVTGQAPLIDVSKASTGTVFDTRQLAFLPSGGRSPFLFAATVPTVVASGDAQFNRQQDQTNASLVSLGGGTRRGNNYLIDGVPITDMRNRASANPSLEAIEDVAVQVHQYNAEAGGTGGGIFNVATKSGTNAWHGSGFYQTRPTFGAANNYYSQLAGVPKPDTYFHLAGGAIGGPIIANRTFFWFSAEGYGSNTTRNGSLRFPTSRERRGDFSQTFNAQGQLVVIYDPLTGDANGNNRQPFPGNIVPDTRIDNVAREITSYLPLPDRDVSDGSRRTSPELMAYVRGVRAPRRLLFGHGAENRSARPHAAPQQLGFRGGQRDSLRRQPPWPDQAGSTQRDEYRESSGPYRHAGQHDLRSDPRAIRSCD